MCAAVLGESDKGLQHVFIDIPGSLQDEELLKKALEVAHDVIVPLPPEALAFDPTARTIAKVIEPTGLPYRVVINSRTTPEPGSVVNFRVTDAAHGGMQAPTGTDGDRAPLGMGPAVGL
ncbi:hypothetical protein ACFZBU_47295 [Embleya sp. NPDC008237]|uniref:hypothetical protein n=1 Tax=Embleya sp. NPDC008237 TaxID=3363978 RepID=UPI0036E30E05